MITLTALVSGTMAATALQAGAAQGPRTMPAAAVDITHAMSPRERAACRYRVSPAPAVDTSERVAPGASSPGPLPVPEVPAGGARMAECGMVLPPNAPPAPRGVGFASWMITDLDSGAVLAARDPHGRQRPASLIKIVLGLVVARELDQRKVVIGTQEDANQEGTKVGIGPGGRYTVNQLLHGLLMHSGNDIAHALAVQLGGPEETVRKMNALARKLGAHDTRIASPSGLDGPGMSSSAYDLSLLFRTAMNNRLFADAVHTKQLRFPGFRKNPPFVISNDNRLLGSYPGDLGGKTGFTDDAQHTFANAAERDGHRLALVMMYGTNHLEGMYRNAHQLMDYGFQLAAAGTPPVGRVPDEQASGGVGPTRQVGNDNWNANTASQPAGDGNGTGPWIVVVLVVVILALIGGAVLRRRFRS
ncbi:MAG: D-alanyl-D-alanine carboxypeptidase family protein [Sciscionella sp.]